MPTIRQCRRPLLIGPWGLLALAVIPMGCDRPADDSGTGRHLPEDTRVCIIGPYETHPNWQGIRGGARRFGATYPNVDCLAVAPTRDDPKLLATLVQAVCDNDPQAICLVVNDPDVARPLAQKISRHSPPITLVIVGERLDDVVIYGNVEVAWQQGAEMLGSQVADIVPDKRSFVLVHERGKGGTASRCYDHFIVPARRQARLSMLENRDASDPDQSPGQLVRDLLTLYPHVGLVVTLTPQPWLEASPETWLGADHRFATLTTAPRLWPSLRRGRAAALVGPLDGDIGYAAVDMAVRALMEIPTAPRRTVIPCELVTRDTLDDFERRYAESAALSVGALTPFEHVPAPASQSGGG